MAMDQEIEKLIRCDAEEDDDDVVINYDKLKHATTKAVLVKIDGDEKWIPYSQIVHHEPDDCEMIITSWIAGEKGLL